MTIRPELLVVMILATTFSFGQEFRRFELGTQTTILRTRTGTSGCGGCEASLWGIGPEFTFNLNRTFSLDSAVSFFPRASKGGTEFYGGNLTQLLSGVKASIRDSRFSFFAKARPGFVSWSDAVRGVQMFPPGSVPSFRLLLGRQNFFTINLSGGFEYLVRPQVGLTVEMGETIIRRSNLTGIAQYGHDLQSSIGVHYHFGSLTSIERIKGDPHHRLFDRLNIGLLTMSLLAQTADAITTQRAQSHCRATNPQPVDPISGGCAALEANPIARPFVTHGWGGQIAVAGIVNTAQVAVMYGMHRMGYHRVERVPPIALTLGSIRGAYLNQQR